MARTKKADICPLTAEQIRDAGRLYGLGLTHIQLAAFFGVSRRTWTNWMNKWPKLKESIKEGDAKATATVVQTLFKMATNGKNTAATIFWLKARRVMSDYRDFRGEEERTLEIAADGKSAKVTYVTQWGNQSEAPTPGLNPAASGDGEA